MISCEIEIDLSWSNKCISVISITSAVPGNPDTNPPVLDVAAIQTSATFPINNAKLYVPVATLYINEKNKFLENIKQRFKVTISWNKYKSEITTQPKNNSLDYLIDPTFRNINRLPVFLLKNGDNDPTRDIFEKNYILMH